MQLMYLECQGTVTPWQTQRQELKPTVHLSLEPHYALNVLYGITS